MSNLLQTLWLNLALVAVILVILWRISIARRDASIIDPFWGTGFVIVAWICVLFNARFDMRSLLLAGLTTLWGLRLSLFLLWRNWGHAEDRRYAAMRHHHGDRFAWISLFTVFLLQGLILCFVSFPIQAGIAISTAAPLQWIDAIGAAIWTIGFCFESIGDWQLTCFKTKVENAGRVMDSGLWKFTRHPNYFGDFLVWWGIYLLAIPTGAWWTIGSPLLMSILLMKVSGVTLLESTIRERRPDYAAYQSRTNAFFPWFPKSSL